MATKLNGFKKGKPDIDNAIKMIKDASIGFGFSDDAGHFHVAGWFPEKAREIRDKAANAQGKAEVCVAQADKNGKSREEYQDKLYMINDFLKRTKNL